MTAQEAAEKVKALPVDHILDIGSGTGAHAEYFRKSGKRVTTISLLPPADYQADYLTLKLPCRYHCIWAAHVLEHQPNPGQFLKKCFSDLADDGWLAVTVPPLKHEIVGGHLTLWNEGLLLYNLVMAGFDCSQAMVKRYGYNISVIVQKREAVLPDLHMDNGDISRLSQYFPVPVYDGFDGRLENVNW